MAKNRKSERTAVRFAPAVRTFLLCLIIGGVGLGYVAQKKKIAMLSEQSAALEERHIKLERQRQNLLWKLERLQSFTELEAQIKSMKLELSPATPDRIVRITVQPGYPAGQHGLRGNPKQVAQMTVPR
ncbi:MAG: hypothetical protein EXS31_02040 [Pedosphaera sp.]|nr:hypothetical protein [Pedosphaera sp.]